MNLSTVALLALYIALLCTFVFAFFFADTADAGLKGRLSRFLLRDVPGLTSALAKSILGERVHSQCLNAIDYTFNRRNPILQVLESLF